MYANKQYEHFDIVTVTDEISQVQKNAKQKVKSLYFIDHHIMVTNGTWWRNSRNRNFDTICRRMFTFFSRSFYTGEILVFTGIRWIEVSVGAKKCLGSVTNRNISCP
jgi:hypothetical protein